MGNRNKRQMLHDADGYPTNIAYIIAVIPVLAASAFLAYGIQGVLEGDPRFWEYNSWYHADVLVPVAVALLLGSFSLLEGPNIILFAARMSEAAKERRRALKERQDANIVDKTAASNKMSIVDAVSQVIAYHSDDGFPECHPSQARELSSLVSSMSFGRVSIDVDDILCRNNDGIDDASMAEEASARVKDAARTLGKISQIWACNGGLGGLVIRYSGSDVECQMIERLGMELGIDKRVAAVFDAGVPLEDVI